MDITARNEIYITSGSQGSIKGITEEPTHCATAVLSFLPAKHYFYFNLFSWLPLCIASSCAKTS